MANGATEHLLHLLRQNPLLDRLHQIVGHLLVCAHRLQDLVWYGYQILSSRQRPKLRVEGHLIHPGKEGAHLTSETLITTRWPIK